MALTENAKKLAAMWQDVRNDNQPLRWVIARCNDNSTDLEVAGSGNTGLSDMCKALRDLHGVLFGGLRCAAIDNRGALRSIRTKFIRFSLITDDTPPMRRAKASSFQSIFETIFCDTHVSFNINSVDDLDPKLIERKLQSSAGAHLPNHYDFEGADDVHAVVVKEAPTPKAVLSIEEAWKKVLNDKDEANFVVIECTSAVANEAKVVACERGSLEDFKSKFEDDKIMYGGFRLRALDDRGTVVSVRSKLFFVSCIGRNVRPLARAKAGQLKGVFEAQLSGTHLSIAVSDAEEIQENDLKTMLLRVGGAHMPNKFDFSGNKSLS